VTFWNTVIRFERSKVTPWIGLRNALGVALPLIVGAAIGQTAGGLMTAIGALNVSYSDGVEPYRQRAWRMLAASCFGALAVGAGGLLSRDHLLPVPLAAVCAFAAGMMAAVGETPSNIGVMTLATLIVFAAQAMTPVAALQSGLLAFGGGLLQTGLAVASWPMRRYGPERRALAALYSELARSAGNAEESAASNAAPPASQQSTDAQRTLTSLAGDHSLEAERYVALLNQAERIRLALLALARLRIRLGRESGSGAQAAVLDQSLKAASHALTAIAEWRGAMPCADLSDAGGARGTTPLDQVRQIEAAANQLRGSADAMTLDARRQLDALAGQIRSAAELAFHTTPAGSAVFAARESAIPWTLRLAGAMANLRANLSLDSAIFRHALRMAACVAIGEAISRYTGSRRGYWLPMTVAIVLRPDFTGTFTRGVLRVGGTLAGLLVATGLVYFLMPAVGPEIFLIVFFTFLLRCYGSANYGIFVMALTALIVFLVSLTGLAPGPIMIARGLNTMAGGAIALAAYWLWPTWERTLTPDLLADMLDAYRHYLQAVRDAYLNPSVGLGVEPGGEFDVRLDRTRLAARLARSNAEASLARLRAEPGVSEDRIDILSKTLVSSHRLVHALMSMEAGLATSAPVPPREAFRKLANDADATIYFLAAALRGSAIERGHLPDLREDHHALLQSGDPRVDRYALVNVETDRVVNSLNTLSGHVLYYTQRFATPVTR
jgi:uncharacterized membrane protein YccC